MRSVQRLGGVAAFAILSASTATWGQTRPASDYPSRPVRFIVAQAAGSGVDLMTRIIARKLSESFGQQVIVDNRPGANGIIGLEAGARSKPDGYTMTLAVPGSTILNLFIYKSLPFDTFRDFTPVIQTSTNTFGFVVNRSLPARAPKDVVALARQYPGELRYGSFGAGNMTHLASELFSQTSSIKLLHVPFKGETPSVTALLGGEVGIMLTPMQAFAPYVRDGRVRLLATLGEKRSVAFPDAPTMLEVGFRDLVIAGWSGVLSPAGTPAEIVSRMQQEIARALSASEIREHLIQQGAEPVAGSTEQFRAFLKAEAAKWSRVIASAGLQATQ